MENLRNRVDIKLVTNKEKLLKYVSKPSFVSSKIINENLVAIHKLKETVIMNCYYNYIKKKYNDKARLLFTDTDSHTYDIEPVIYI